MPRPKSKEELLQLSEANFKKLTALLEHMDKDELSKDFPPGTLNRNVRDVLCHLHHWHLLLLGWYATGMKGEKPEMPAKGYTWKTMPAFNQWIQQHYQHHSLEQAQKLVSQSYSDVRQLIMDHSNDELFEKKRYKWTGSTSLGAYVTSATSSHYDWAFKLIKKAKSV